MTHSLVLLASRVPPAVGFLRSAPRSLVLIGAASTSRLTATWVARRNSRRRVRGTYDIKRSDQTTAYPPPPGLSHHCQRQLANGHFLALVYGVAAQGRGRGQGGTPDARCNLFRMPLYASPPRDHVEPTPPSCWTFDLLGFLADQATTGIILTDDFTNTDKAQSKSKKSRENELRALCISLLLGFISPSAYTRANSLSCRGLPFGHGQDLFKHLRGRSSAHCC